MLSPSLQSFLTNYLAVEPNVGTAVRSFVSTEGPTQPRQLLRDLRAILAADPTAGGVTREIQALGNVHLKTRAETRELLLRLFSLVAREAKLPADIKAYDAFISYSSHDHELASWLAAELRRYGYVVWLDRDEILVGHNILDEVYRGIVQSRFLIVLLSSNSVASRWVREELSAARISEIENAQVVVLPVRCERNVEIPAALRTKRFADFSNSREEGLEELMRAMDLHATGAIPRSEVPIPAATFTGVRAWSTTIGQEAVAAGYDPQQGGYKDVIVGPPDGDQIRIENRSLLDLLDQTRVRYRGWGGGPFPYEARKARIENIRDGIQLIDTHTWPHSVWSFYFWLFTNTGRFFQRTGLLEDGSTDPRSGEVILRDRLSFVWVIQDVCAALQFASRLLNQLPSAEQLLVIQRLGGMRNRELVVRGFDRAPRIGEYICREDVIEEESMVTRTTDLEEEAIRVLGQIFWLFNWRDFTRESVTADVKAFMAGEFPRT